MHPFRPPRRVLALSLPFLLVATALAQPPSRGGDREGRSFGGRGGPPFGDRGGRGGFGGRRGGDRGGFDPSGFIGRLDRNGNGMIDPDEQEGPARFMISRLQQADPSIDTSRPIPIDRFTKAFEQMRSGRGASRRGSNDQDGGRRGPGRGDDSEEGPEAALVELVPGFGGSALPPPVPGFGAAAELFAVRVLPEDQREAENSMRRYDRDRDGFLSEGEFSRRWSGNPLDYDRNRDGKLSPSELAVRYARRRAEGGADDANRADHARGGRGEERGRDRWRRGEGRRDWDEEPEPPDPLDGRRSLRLPRPADPEGLPGWFSERDRDRDGQVTMEEYTSQWNEQLVQEFFQFDTNRDGVITARECLVAVEQGARRGGSGSAGPDAQQVASSQPAERNAAGGTGEISDKNRAHAQRVVSENDQDGDGVLNRSEGEAMLLDPSPADADGDGSVTVEEYAAWLQRRADRLKK